MRKIYSLLVMLIASFAAFQASADSYNIKVVVDHPERVVVKNSLTDQTYDLTSGTNSIDLEDPYDYGGVSFSISRKSSDFFLQSLLINGSDTYLWDNTSYYTSVGTNSGNDPVGTTYTVTTGSYLDLRTSTLTINVNNASEASVRFNGASEGINLVDGTNTVKFSTEIDCPLAISHAYGSQKYIGVKHNGTVKPWTQYETIYIDAANGDVIDIDTEDPNAVKYNLTFAEGTNLDAISRISVNGSDLTDWRSGVRLDAGTSGYIYLDDQNYTISDVTVGGYSYSYYQGYGIYFYLDSDISVSFTATASTTAYSNVNFRLEGWKGNGLTIYRGSSIYSSTVDFTSSSFSDQFEGDSQDYLVKVADGYVIDSIRLMHNGSISNVKVLDYGTTFTLKDGDSVEITMHEVVDTRTASLFVNANLNRFSGDISISNGYVNSYIYGGNNEFKFDPAVASERNFTLTSSVKLHSVKLGDNEISPSGTSTFTYYVSGVTDGQTITIVAVDPNYEAPTSDVIFDEESMLSAVDCVIINNETYLPASTWQDSHGFKAEIGSLLTIRFKPGYKVSSLWFEENSYEYKPSAFGSQDLDYYENDNIYQFSHVIESEYSVVSFTASEPVVVTKNVVVSFNVNIPAGVVITDVSTDTHTNVAVDGKQFSHTFTNDYNYINIQAAEGYNLTDVSINPNDGASSSYSPSISDNKAQSIMVENGYAITITVEEAQVTPPAPEFGSFTVNLVGDPACANFVDGGNKPIALVAGSNTINLTAETATYYLMAAPGKTIESVTLNGDAVDGVFFYTLTVTKDDVVVITTEGATPAAAASFTVNISGDASKVNYLEDQNHGRYTVGEGENVIELPDDSGSFGFMIDCDEVLYSVKLNGTDVRPSYGTNYMVFVSNGDVIDIQTEIPAVDVHVSWNFSGCDSSIISGLQLGNGAKLTPDDEDFADYLDGFDVQMGTVVTFWLDNSNANITSVTFNGEENGTNTYQYFPAMADTEVTISARQKKVFDYTLFVNIPKGVNIYKGLAGNGQPIELDTQHGGYTTLSLDERYDDAFITVVPNYGYFFDYCIADGKYLTPNDEGNYVIYPGEDSYITVYLSETPRPYTAAIYFDSLADFTFANLTSGRFTAASSSEGTAIEGYTVFSFNDTDLGSGMNLSIGKKEGVECEVMVYVNNVLQQFDNEQNQLANMMIADGDVIKVFTIEPLTHTVSFNIATTTDKFTIKLDRITDHDPFSSASTKARVPAATVASGTSEMFQGTEVTIIPSDDAYEPWVKVDDEWTKIPTGKSHSFVATGNHEVLMGENFTTGVESIFAPANGSTEVFNLQGIRVADDVKALQPGLYIIGGKKVLVK